MEQSINVAVVIPWREKGDRKYAFKIVRSWYENNLPNAKIILADDEKKDFCLAGCRNIGVKNAEDAGADVVVISDADTIPEIGPLLEAIESASNDGYVHLPYNEYRSLRQKGTKEFLKGKKLEDCNSLVVDGACSGVYVSSPKTWWSHHGQDERFRGWGFEDAAWYTAHTVLLDSEPVRHNGRVYAMHHESQGKEGELYDTNAQLCATYLSQPSKESMNDLAKGGLFLS